MPQPLTETNQLLYDAKAVRELDRIAIEEKGIAGIVLMKRAGQAVFSAIKKHWPDKNNLLILCGAGNNGGDGYIVAGLALQAGMQVRVHETTDPASAKGDAKRAREFALAQGVQIQAAEEFEGKDRQSEPLAPDSVVVDALLGTGFQGELRGSTAILVDQLHRALGKSYAVTGNRVPVVSVDVPSGLDSTTGRAASNAIKADLTISFIGRKFGLYTGDGPVCAGELLFDDLGVPNAVYSPVKGLAEVLSLSSEVQSLPTRPITNHKGSHGHVLVIGGDRGMGGAPLMTAISVARMGAGLVSVATHPSHASSFISVQPELMVRGVSHAPEVRSLIDKASLIAVGPGLGTTAWGQGMLQAALASEKPLVLDADALNLIADGSLPVSLSLQRAERAESAESAESAEIIMTPHPGEAARLLGISVAEVQSDRLSSIKRLTEKFGGVQVLKGAGTLVDNGGQTFVCPYGNPGMGTGGMGDVLTGVIAGLWAQGISAVQAANLGVCLHSASADQLAETRGQRGLLATDLIPVARELLNGI